MKAAIGSMVVLGGLLAASPISLYAAPQATTTATDQTLDTRIEKRIHDSSLKKYDINVTVADGVATLTGTVSTEADRRKAAQLATITGIARVDNQLVVHLPSGPNAKGTVGRVERKADKAAEKTKEGVDKAMDKTKEGVAKAADKTKEGGAVAIDKTKEGAEKTQEAAEKGWDKTKEGAGVVVDKTKEGLSKTGEAITDAWITTRVKMKFVGEDLLKDSDINVDVKDHVVTLSGTVPSAAGRARAIAQAKEVEGVHQVVDRLMIGPKK